MLCFLHVCYSSFPVPRSHPLHFHTDRLTSHYFQMKYIVI
jgi:hypothetical protein